MPIKNLWFLVSRLACLVPSLPRTKPCQKLQHFTSRVCLLSAPGLWELYSNRNFLSLTYFIPQSKHFSRLLPRFLLYWTEAGDSTSLILPTYLAFGPIFRWTVFWLLIGMGTDMSSFSLSQGLANSSSVQLVIALFSVKRIQASQDRLQMSVPVGSCPKSPVLTPLAFVPATPHPHLEGLLSCNEQHTRAGASSAMRSRPLFPYSILTHSGSVKGKYQGPLIGTERTAKTKGILY